MRILVLGASGGFGAALAGEMAKRGHAVRALARDPARARRRLGRAECEIVAGDVQDGAGVMAAARGCAVVVHGVNYPYAQWRPHMQTATANILAAARGGGALLVFPGNVYGLGRQTGHPLPETARNQPSTSKGKLRVELEESMASAVDGVRVLLVRAGDFFGPTVRNGLVDRIFGKAAMARPMEVFGRLDVPHQWAYMPDLARATGDLIERSEALRPFELVHFEGHVAASQGRFLAEVRAAAGHPRLKIRRLPWWLMRAAGLFDPQIRELMELRYLFDEAVILEGPRMRELLPHFRQTPLPAAIAATLASYRS